MNNPGLMRKTLIVFILLLSVCFSFTANSYGQEETYMVLFPESIDVGSGEGTTSFEILFEGPATPAWTIVGSYEWIIIEPVTGEGNATVYVTYEANTGIGRTGEIIITATGALNSPDTILLNQYNGLPSETIDITFQQLDYFSPGNSEVLYSGGYVHISYDPFPEGVFLNIGARSEFSTDTAWIVKNIYLPDSNWIGSTQEFSIRFDLALLGVLDDMTLGAISYFWNISESPFTSFVDKHPGIEHVAGVPRGGTFIVTGRKGTPTTSNTFEFLDTLLYYLPFTLEHEVYIGCNMPNGDLDKETRDGELNGCGPAAASNSLNWLEKEHTPEIDIKPEWRDAFNELSTLMSRAKNGTVDDEDFIRAKLDFIEMYKLPIKVKFQDDALKNDIKSTSGNSSAECKDKNAGYPKKSWLISEAEEEEDIEIGVTYPGDTTGHWVAFTGTYTLNGITSIWYKHDTIQEKPGGLAQEHSVIIEKDGKMIIPGLSNATCDILVSESYDPDYSPPPTSFDFNKYCQSFKKTLAPGKKVNINFPDTPGRCFNTTLRVLDRAVSDSYKKEATWNHNNGKTRTYVNNTGHPVTIELHNDDKYDGGLPESQFKNYVPYHVNLIEMDAFISDVSTESNEDVFGGFSLGTDDDSSDEFGFFVAQNYVFTDSIGSYLGDIPGNISANLMTNFTINHNVPVWNDYWSELELIIGIHSVNTAGALNISSIATGLDTTILISTAEDISFPIGGMLTEGMFDLTFNIVGNLDFTFDNIGIPSLVQVTPVLSVVPNILNLTATIGDTTFVISNTRPVAEPMSWTITKTGDWFSLNKTSGTETDTIRVFYEANTGDTRYGLIVITSAGSINNPDNILVSQDSASTSIIEVEKPSTWTKVFPNPNNGKFSIKLVSETPNNASIEVFDIQGKAVYRKDQLYVSGELIEKVDLGPYSKGIFYIRVTIGDDILNNKVVIE
ncbi:BACON domain-containing protein [Bacteroidota bacterium]